MKNAWVTIGRYGDCLNTLGLVYHDYQQGNKPTFVIGEQWASLLDGVSYCDRLVWHGSYAKPLEAAAWVKSLNKFDTVHVPQCYGQSFKQECSNFCEEAWRLVGKQDLWGNIPLVLDRRDRQREAKLLPATTKPIVLVNTDGVSSKFPFRDELNSAINGLSSTHHVVDLSAVRAERFYDLLGLYEAADYLVSVDTGTLHLAEATPNLGVIALVTNTPTPWHGTPYRSNHVLRMIYPEFPKRKGEIIEVIRSGAKAKPRMVHVWSDYYRSNPGTQRRHTMAKLTWEKEMAGWVDVRCIDSDFVRNSHTDFGDKKHAPYVTDLINQALKHARGNDIIVLTNDDTCVCPDLEILLRKALRTYAAVWSARREHRRIDRVMTVGEMMRGRKHVGADIFAFSKSWWLTHGDKMPDMLFSFENWDYVLRTIINQNGGGEVDGLCYHEIHTPDWTLARESSAARHNQAMGGEFFDGKK